ncbi:hypothetical protein VTK73DRAFT_26 [Phialemonium thermophilum]|uniref:Uncharacterized protein n=1 Tax=Phialemonium thermophilum TaxID=223376 RepID=A0ABR3Y900_9PEZI
MTSTVFPGHSNVSLVSHASSAAPSYATHNPNSLIELSRLTADDGASRSSVDGVDSVLDGPPPYTRPTTFSPSMQLQIQTAGKPWLSSPLPPRAEAIPIFDVLPDGSLASHPRYVSVRPIRGKGSCYLIPGNDAGAEYGGERRTTVSTTAYRFGPGKPPYVRLYLPGAAGEAELEALEYEGDHENEEDVISTLAEGPTWDAFAVQGCGMLTRARRFRTRLGTFEWRYGTRAERKAAVPGGANSLLVLDRIARVARKGAHDPEESRTPVAWFVRSKELRTPGTRSSTAGNGGRLMLDLSLWDPGNGGEKADREMMVVLTVTTLLVMLKREVDRRRAQQMMIIAAVASGG